MRDLIKVKLQNCKNVEDGEIVIEKNALNVKYANNGTGKSTLADAIKYYIENDTIKLNTLKSYNMEEIPAVLIEPNNFSSIEVFNEDFVNNVVFDKQEAIKNSFDVFIRTPEFDSKRSELDESLREIKTDLKENKDIIDMTMIFNLICEKISFNRDNSIARKGMGKDIINPVNVYKLPRELEKYKCFFQAEERTNWIDWKSKGQQFDDKGACPFCAEILDSSIYKDEKEVFNNSYSKSMVKNQKELEDSLIKLKIYLDPMEYERLYSYTREIKNVDDFMVEFKRFYEEVELINRKISEVLYFDTHDVDSDDLEKLDKKIESLLIETDIIKLFNSDLSLKTFKLINSKIKNLLYKVKILKNEFEEINTYIQNAIEKSEADINNFLETAGINYKFIINPTSETSSKTELKYCGRSGDIYNVDDIKESLSWGEKNSISLILFMYYALQKEADIIVLDDPISSFDKNKKFAILFRLFNPYKESLSFHGRTVILLTHDLEPIIDLKIKKYFKIKQGNGYYLTNKDGKLSETKIDVENDILPTILISRFNISNSDLDIVLRIAALRKYLEYTESDCLNENMPYNIISSLMKCRPKDKINIGSKKSNLMGNEQFDIGCYDISMLLGDVEFDYEYLLNNEFTTEKLIEKYESEENSYNKIQLFRAYYDSTKNVRKELNIKYPVIKKYADESFHIENDYSHCLDYRRYDIVPHFIMSKVDQYMSMIISEAKVTYV